MHVCICVCIYIYIYIYILVEHWAPLTWSTFLHLCVTDLITQWNSSILEFHQTHAFFQSHTKKVILLCFTELHNQTKSTINRWLIILLIIITVLKVLYYPIPSIFMLGLGSELDTSLLDCRTQGGAWFLCNLRHYNQLSFCILWNR